MREILFRGKRIDKSEWVDNSEWVEGVYYKQTEFYGDACESYYIISSTEDLGYDQALEYCEVLPETIGQYTGLNDDKGRAIFEGDIVKYCYGDLRKRGVVFYHEKGAKFGVKEKDYENLSILHYIHIKEWELEVIGNIYDNPELLEV